MRAMITALGAGTVTSIVSAIGWPALLLVAVLAVMTFAAGVWILAADSRTRRLAVLIGRDWKYENAQNPPT